MMPYRTLHWRGTLVRLAACGLVPVGTLLADSVTVPVYGVLEPGALDPAAASALQAQQPGLFQELQMALVTVPVAPGTQASQAQAIASLGLGHAQLTATGHSQGPTYVLDALQAMRVEALSSVSGSVATTVIAAPGAAPWLSCVRASTTVLIYAISGPDVFSQVLGAHFSFPTVADADAFRVVGGGTRLRGTSDGVLLSYNGAHIAPLAQVQVSALGSYAGAYVQLRDAVCGAYLYVPQNQITLSDPALYDPVARDGQLLLGGSSRPGALPGQVVVSYVLNQVTCSGTCQTSAGMPATALPPTLGAQAQASELAPAAPAGATTVITTQNRGPVPVLDDSGAPTGAEVTFYAQGPAARQSTVQVLSDIDAQRANAASAAPLDTMATATQPDRITTPSSGVGTTGLNQLQAQDQAASWTYATTGSGSDVQTTLTTQPGAAAADPSAATLSGAALMALSDQSLDDQVTTTYSAQGVAQPAQAVPLVTNAQGPIGPQAGAPSPPGAHPASASLDIYSAVDIVNQVMAPHLEDTSWPGGLPAHHHQSLIHPIDYLDAALTARYAPFTGVAIPDQLGDPIPGDGANPVVPVPLGCAAGHPFYDLDGDGSLDRWYSDDPFHGGYQKVKLLWAEQPGGTYQLGDFSVAPAYNVCLVGVTAPRHQDDGTWQAHEDLLLTIGHDFKPFSHAALHRLSYQTFYGSGLVSALDPLAADDPSLYRFALRNTATLASASPPAADGIAAAQLVPVVVSAVQLGQAPPGMAGAGGALATATLFITVDWYDALTGLLTAPDWTPGWSQAGFVLPAGIGDHPGAPAVVQETWCSAAGTVLQRLTVSRPQYVDPGGATSGPFDPSLIPVAPQPPPADQPVADTYMWDYPQDRPTAAGGTVPATPAQWQFPWNLAWNADVHSRNQSTQGFQLDSANMQLFPAYAGSQPLITHAGLVAAAAAAGTAMPALEWQLREVPATDPPPGQDVAAWCSGAVLYTQAGWAPPAPWMTPGRALFHVPWDGRCDIYGADPTVIGAVAVPSGERIFDVAGGFAQYTFRGASYTCTTLAEQTALLRRMWNYDLTGFEDPPPGTTTLPSLCIPQRLDNADPTSPWLNTCVLPAAGNGAMISADATDADAGGNLQGALVADLQSAQTPRLRAQVQRRARLMGGQVFLFSAARGREWELQMARRMPASVQLVCVEYDNRSAVKALLGTADVVFPTITTTTLTDSLGQPSTVETSNELQILTTLASQWFDPQAPVVSFSGGRATVGQDTSLHSATVGTGTAATSGSATTIDQAAVGAYPGFALMLPDGLPAGIADCAFVLRSQPACPANQWAPDPGQAAISDYAIEFRHPMLLLYQDQASAIYVHYGRNCDPDTVFGHWDDCAPPQSAIPITSSELLRRQRFDHWATAAQLAQVYAALHPAGAGLAATALVGLPPAPADPGPQPQPPVAVAYPGPEPTAPLLALRNWDAPLDPPSFDDAVTAPLPAALDGYGPDLPWAPWNGDPAYQGLEPEAQWQQYLGTTPEFDASATGWLRIGMSQPDGAGVATSAPTVWSGLAGDAYLPIGAPEVDCSALLYGTLPQAVRATGTHSDNTLTFSQLAPDLTPGAVLAQTVWTASGPVSLPAGPTLLVASNDAAGSGAMWYLAQGRVQSYAAISHPMTQAWYQAYAVLPLVTYEQAILTERQSELSQYQGDSAAYAAQDAQWRQAAQAFAQWLGAQGLYQSQAAAWTDAEAAWTQWQTAAAAQSAAQAAQTAYLAQRTAWVDQVLAQVQAQPVSWSGDPALQLTTLTQVQAEAAATGSPIWQAYAWFIDPANGVGAATQPPAVAGGP